MAGIAAAAALAVVLFGRRDSAPKPADDPVRVFSTAELAGIPVFGAEPVHVQFGPSTALTSQLEVGRPGAADLFIAGNEKDAKTLQRAGRCEEPVQIATDRLVLLSTSPDVVRWQDVGKLPRGRVLADDSGKVAAYARQFAERVGLTTSEGRRLQLMAADRRDLQDREGVAFVFASQALLREWTGRLVAIPKQAQPTIGYWACATLPADAGRGVRARVLLERLQSREAQRALRGSGFGLAG